MSNPETVPDEWFSDEALRKQALADSYMERGMTIPLSVMCGLFEPRTQPTEAERCACGMDAREQAGGEEIDGKRWCFLCISRGRYEDSTEDPSP